MSNPRAYDQKADTQSVLAIAGNSEQRSRLLLEDPFLALFKSFGNSLFVIVSEVVVLWD